MEGDLFWALSRPNDVFEHLTYVGLKPHQGWESIWKKSVILPIGKVKNVECFAKEFGYEVGTSPSYLGLPFGSSWQVNFNMGWSGGEVLQKTCSVEEVVRL